MAFRTAALTIVLAAVGAVAAPSDPPQSGDTGQVHIPKPPPARTVTPPSTEPNTDTGQQLRHPPINPINDAPPPSPPQNGVFTWPDGSKYAGGLRDGHFAGHGIITYPDGATLEADYGTYGGIYGIATYVNATGEKFTGVISRPMPDPAHPRPPLSYPFWRELFGDEANVEIEAIVDIDGRITSAQLLKAIDSPSYRDASLSGIKDWRYRPATIAGHRVRAPHYLYIRYRMPPG